MKHPTQKFYTHPKHLKSECGGFTMLEMLVSLAIFSIVAVIAVGSLVRITGLNRQARSLQDAMTNVSYALESMSRELRMGTNYSCQGGNGAIITDNVTYLQCPADSILTIAFKSAVSRVNSAGNGTCQLIYAYRFTGNQVQKGEQQDCEDLNINPSEFYDIIDSTNVTLDEYELKVSRPSPNKGYSWVEIGLKGYAGVREKERHYFHFFTGVSQRISD